MKILGIDPGMANCGWGVVEKFGSQYKLLGSGCVVSPASMEDKDRLGQIFEIMSKLCVQYGIDIISIEQVFFAKNTSSAFKTSEVIGTAKIVAFLQKKVFIIVTPLQVKMALTGYGRAEKFQIENMVKRFLNVSKPITPSHAADAVAIALTAGFISRSST